MKAKQRNQKPPKPGDMGQWSWPSNEGVEIVRCVAVNGIYTTVERIEYEPDEYNEPTMVVVWSAVKWVE